MVLNKTLKVDERIKNKLESLDFVGKKHTYNEIITKLIEEYEDKKRTRPKRWNK